jgi:adenylate cyclase
MAFIGDPVPVDDPVPRAVALARDLGHELAQCKAAWRARGFPLGHGVGIAYGYATLGVVGYEGRTDYTALGSVVNLASRLCGEAGDGEIVLDARARAALGDPGGGSSRRVDLKGYSDPVEVFVL